MPMPTLSLARWVEHKRLFSLKRFAHVRRLTCLQKLQTRIIASKHCIYCFRIQKSIEVKKRYAHRESSSRSHRFVRGKQTFFFLKWIVIYLHHLIYNKIALPFRKLSQCSLFGFFFCFSKNKSTKFVWFQFLFFSFFRNTSQVFHPLIIWRFFFIIFFTLIFGFGHHIRFFMNAIG